MTRQKRIIEALKTLTEERGCTPAEAKAAQEKLRGLMKHNPKAEKFKELAELRIAKINDGLRVFGNLSNKYFYQATEDEIDEIFEKLEKRIKDLKQRFKTSGMME